MDKKTVKARQKALVEAYTKSWFEGNMMVTYNGGDRYRFCFYDEDDPAIPHPIVLGGDMTLEEDEKKFIKICEWY